MPSKQHKKSRPTADLTDLESLESYNHETLENNQTQVSDLQTIKQKQALNEAEKEKEAEAQKAIEEELERERKVQEVHAKMKTDDETNF